MQRWVWLVIGIGIGIVVGGCGDSGAPSVPPDARACEVIASDFAAALADPGTCVTDADCAVFDTLAPSAFPTCNCMPYLATCPGVVHAANAPGLAQARALADEYWEADCGQRGPSICDCAPYVAIRCIDQRCQGEVGSCFPDPRDAGVDVR